MTKERGIIFSAEMVRSLRDDLTAAHDRTKRAAWRILKQNAELRARVAELEAENTRMRERLVQTQAICDIALLRLEDVRDWQPAPDEMRHSDGTSVVYDDIAITMAYDNTAMATMQWPDDEYEYAVCRRKRRMAVDSANTEKMKGNEE